jgi:hypothetical protein
MQVYVFFWFDVEDYITPQSDIALGRLVDIYDRHDLRATFKMVAEKVRGLTRRGHDDILTKLRVHDIGYHTDYHSKPPSISEYMLQYGWEDGIAEFLQRESEGEETLRQTFGRIPSCYGQPGGAWAAQVYPGLRLWGIPVYLDAGPWVELGGRPHRYCDVLNMLGLDNLMHIGIRGGPDEVRKQQARLGEMVDQLRPTGGEISLYAHECEFVTQAFWDGINYGQGKNTPREQWQPAPLVSKEENEARYAAMDDLLTFVQSLPDVQVVVASQAPTLYLDRAKGQTFTPQQIAALCEPMSKAITHQNNDGAWLSPGEVFSLVVDLMAARARGGQWPDRVPYRYVDGPLKAPHVEVVSGTLPLEGVFGTCLYESTYLDMHEQMPAEVQVGRNWLAPADFMATMAAALPRWLKGDTDDAPIARGNLAQAAHIPDHVSWGWTIFPPGFNGDALLEMGKLQAWTLKPAVE